jgi:hypothetical protein
MLSSMMPVWSMVLSKWLMFDLCYSRLRRCIDIERGILSIEREGGFEVFQIFLRILTPRTWCLCSSRRVLRRLVLNCCVGVSVSRHVVSN